VGKQNTFLGEFINYRCLDILISHGSQRFEIPIVGIKHYNIQRLIEKLLGSFFGDSFFCKSGSFGNFFFHQEFLIKGGLLFVEPHS
jgi:hypothetical protein